MLTQERLDGRLPCRGLGHPATFFATLTSTNDRAAEMAEEGAPHGALIAADEQTAGRGRLKRRWLTPSGTALAFSIILRLEAGITSAALAYAGLGAVAVCEVLEERGMVPAIKWPNDVLVGGKKIAGILAELTWKGTAPDVLILGIGVNVHPGSVPDPASVRFPATCMAQEANHALSRDDLLREIVCSVGAHLGSPAVDWMEDWGKRLAYRGETVSVEQPGGRLIGRLIGLDRAGRLLLEVDGLAVSIETGEIHLKPVDRSRE